MRVIIFFMKKDIKTNKIIIAVLCAVLVVCGGIFGWQAAKSGAAAKKNEKTTTFVSASASGQSGSTVVAGGSFDSDDGEAAAESGGGKSNSPSTSVSAQNQTTKKQSQTGGSANSGGSGETQSAKSEQKTTQKTTAAQKKEITVSFSITCKNAVAYGRSDIPQSGYFIRPEDYSGKEGITVFDVLEAECESHGISLTYQDKYYIQGIGGLKEKECGGGSGWMYRVNGVAPNKAAMKYYLEDGDVVEWYYVTGSTDH